MNGSNVLYWEIIVNILLIGIPVAIILFILLQVRDFFRRYKIVKQNSKYYQNVLNLNKRTNYHKDIGNLGNIGYNINVNSKAKFDRIDRHAALTQYISERKNEATWLLQAVRENRVAYEKYNAQFYSFAPQNSEIECELLNIQFSEFLRIEQKLVTSVKLNIPRFFKINCYVTYSSPHGRKNSFKLFTFSEYDIESAIRTQQRYDAYKRTEEYRRKTERARVSQSVRYDILKRDNFRCRLCGRSAKDGIELEVDHIIPISKGGTSDLKNLQTLCRDCNRGKGSKY